MYMYMLELNQNLLYERWKLGLKAKAKVAIPQIAACSYSAYYMYFDKRYKLKTASGPIKMSLIKTKK